MRYCTKKHSVGDGIFLLASAVPYHKLASIRHWLLWYINSWCSDILCTIIIIICRFLCLMVIKNTPKKQSITCKWSLSSWKTIVLQSWKKSIQRLLRFAWKCLPTCDHSQHTDQDAEIQSISALAGTNVKSYTPGSHWPPTPFFYKMI